jgi:cytoskeletal protein RodZ
MEFSYRICEDEYKQAFRLKYQKNTGIPNVGKTVMFWIFILIGLVLLWEVVQVKSIPAAPSPASPVVSSSGTQNSSPPVHRGSERTESNGASKPVGDSGIPRSLLFNVGPFVILLALWFFMAKRMKRDGVPFLLNVVGTYNQDPLMQGHFTANISSSSISIQNTAGYSAQMNWYLFEGWREAGSVVVLILKLGNYNILSTRELSDPQKSELHGILTAVLPQK